MLFFSSVFVDVEWFAKICLFRGDVRCGELRGSKKGWRERKGGRDWREGGHKWVKAGTRHQTLPPCDNIFSPPLPPRRLPSSCTPATPHTYTPSPPTPPIPNHTTFTTVPPHRLSSSCTPATPPTVHYTPHTTHTPPSHYPYPCHIPSHH